MGSIILKLNLNDKSKRVVKHLLYMEECLNIVHPTGDPRTLHRIVKNLREKISNAKCQLYKIIFRNFSYSWLQCCYGNVKLEVNQIYFALKTQNYKNNVYVMTMLDQ